MSDKQISRIITAVSVFVLIVVVVLQSKLLNIFPDKDAIPGWVFSLPLFNAVINGTCSVLLILSLYFIKRKNIIM